jgi:hypothetical protein
MEVALLVGVVQTEVVHPSVTSRPPLEPWAGALGPPVSVVPVAVDPTEVGVRPEVVTPEGWIVLPPPLDLMGPGGQGHDEQRHDEQRHQDGSGAG